METSDVRIRGRLHPPGRGDGLDGRIAAVAASQGGVIGRGQLLDLGLGRHAIDRRAQRGELHPKRRGVYAVGHPHIGRLGHFWVAVLGGGPGAVLGYRSAAVLWEIRLSAGRRAEVIVVRGGRRSDRTLYIHRVRSLDEQDITTRHGLPVTTVPRTLLDLADVLSATALDRAIEQAQNQQLFDATAITDVIARANGRHGAKRLERALIGLVDTPPTLRSDLERAFLDLCARYGLPRPVTNAIIEGFEVDAHWPGTRLIVELDGRAIHGTPQAFERDRRRDRRLGAAGYHVVRITARQLATEPDALAADLRSLLGRFGA